MTIGRYQRTNRPILIIGKTADYRSIPIISTSLSMVYLIIVKFTIFYELH